MDYRCVGCGSVFTTIFEYCPDCEKRSNYDLENDVKHSVHESVVNPGLKGLKDVIAEATADNVNHPSHYNSYKGVEVIDLTEQMNFNRGNAVKYIARAGLKSPQTEVEDLKKAQWYITREIKRLESIKPRVAVEARLCMPCVNDKCQDALIVVEYNDHCECCKVVHVRKNA